MVRINNMKIRGFGRFAHKSLELNSGLNIIYGGNEAGKTTLHRFIEAMLFGFWQPYGEGTAKEPFWERYYPWQRGAFGGELVYTWKGGRVLLERDFSSDSLAVTDAESGEMLTGLERNAWREPDFAHRHLGLSKLMFRNTISISQLGAATDIEALTEIRAMLKNLARSGGSGLSIQQSLLRIEAARSEIGGEDSLGKPLTKARELCEHLTQRLEQARAQLAEARSWELEFFQANTRLEALQTERHDLHSALQRWRGQMAARQLELLGNLDHRQRQVSAQLEELPDLQLPPDVLQIQEQLRLEIASLWADISSLRQQIGELEESCQGHKAKLERLEIYRQYNQDTLIDMSSAWQLLTKGLQVISELRQQQQTLNEGIRETTTSLGKLPYFRSDVLEQAAAWQQQAQGTVLLDSREDLGSELAQKERALTAYRWGRGLSLALVPALGALYLVSPILAPLALVPLGGFFLLAAGQQRLSQRLRSLRRQIYTLELEFQNGIRQREYAQRELAAMLAKAGVKGFKELEKKYRLFVDLGERNRELQREYKFLTGKLESYEEEMMEKDQELQGILRRVGVADLPMEEALRQFRGNLDQVLEAETALRTTQERLQKTQEREGQKDFTLKARQEQLTEFYRRWQVYDGQGLEALVQVQGQREELQRELVEIHQRRRDLLQGTNAAQLEREATQAGEAEPPGGDAPQHLEQLGSEIMALQARRGELLGRLEGIYPNLESPAALEEELAEAQARWQELQAKRASLDLARAALEEVAAALSRQLAPGLNQRVSQIVKRITGDRFSDLGIDEEMNITISTPQTREPVALESLSGGTIDQIYFACRVAIADLVAGNSNLPLFLDDSFIQYDDERLARMLDLLLELAGERQILLFTCQRREHQLLSAIAPEQYTFINLDAIGG